MMQFLLSTFVPWIVLGSITSAVVSIVYRDHFNGDEYDGYEGYRNLILFLLGAVFPLTIIVLLSVAVFTFARRSIIRLFKIKE
jgi:heme/copper-type cytochrome/quinol oxidase subunit 2